MIPAPAARPRRMTRISEAFERARAEGRSAFVAYLTAGDPSPGATIGLARALASSGTDVLELGVPFSDPIADGPVLQRAASRALAAGTTLAVVFSIARRIRAETTMALVLFSYVNPILRYGVARAARDARAAGIDGVLLTDVPPEEAPALQPLFRQAGLDTIFLVSPTLDAGAHARGRAALQRVPLCRLEARNDGSPGRASLGSRAHGAPGAEGRGHPARSRSGSASRHPRPRGAPRSSPTAWSSARPWSAPPRRRVSSARERSPIWRVRYARRAPRIENRQNRTMRSEGECLKLLRRADLPEETLLEILVRPRGPQVPRRPPGARGASSNAAERRPVACGDSLLA